MPTPAEIQRLLAAAERNLADSRVTAVSDENRFDAAYKAIMQCALAAMMAGGYRPSTSEPGHHQTLIQSLPLTLGVPNATWVVLDALRRKRNTADYSGDPGAARDGGRSHDAGRRVAEDPGCLAKGTAPRPVEKTVNPR